MSYVLLAITVLLSAAAWDLHVQLETIAGVLTDLQKDQHKLLDDIRTAVEGIRDER